MGVDQVEVMITVMRGPRKGWCRSRALAECGVESGGAPTRGECANDAAALRFDPVYVEMGGCSAVQVHPAFAPRLRRRTAFVTNVASQIGQKVRAARSRSEASQRLQKSKRHDISDD